METPCPTGRSSWAPGRQGFSRRSGWPGTATVPWCWSRVGVDERARAIAEFFARGALDPTNVAFGEGGAGAWSTGS